MRTKFIVIIITGFLLIVITLVTVFYLRKNNDTTIFNISNSTTVFFPKTNIDLGTIEACKTIRIMIPFENRGENGLKIYNIVPECGCSVPEWPLRPIPSGAKDTIRVTFTPSGTGYFKKSLSIFANNINGPIIISLSCSSK